MDRKRQKHIILILAILLAVSICILAGILIYRAVTGFPSDSEMIPDNIITPEAEPSVPGDTEQTLPESQATQPTEPQPTTTGGSRYDEAPVLSLHKTNSKVNVTFKMENFFPGDQKTERYCVRISYQDKAKVRFNTEIRPGYEKLAEALECRITLLTTGDVLYDGLMCDMPASLDHRVSSDGTATDDLYYEITAGLDTSVGNEYQNQVLIADFCWWVDDSDDLIDAPSTGDAYMPMLWLSICLSSIAILFLLAKLRKEEPSDEK